MAPATAHAVLDQINSSGAHHLHWGRALPVGAALSGRARRALGDGHVVHLITNGTLLPRLRDFVDAFRDRRVSVQFSINGVGANYERIRQRSHWNTVVESIRLLNRRRREGNNQQAVITTNYLLMRQALDDLPNFIRFCAREGIDAISLTYAMIYESMVLRGEISEADSVYYYQNQTNAAVQRAIKVARQENISLSASRRFLMTPHPWESSGQGYLSPVWRRQVTPAANWKNSLR